MSELNASPPTAVASYLPESLLIRVGPDLQLFAERPEDHQPPTAAALGYFFHEYCHYLHNLSTLSGLAAWINTIELWRLFRLTLTPDGRSQGSGVLSREHQDHLERLLHYLTTARRVLRPQLSNIAVPEGLRFTTLQSETVVAGSENSFLTGLTGEAEVFDRNGSVERIQAQVGTIELLESAAWLLESLLVQTIAAGSVVQPPPVFPYSVFEAAIAFRVPDIGVPATIACALAALQSSDPFHEIEVLFSAMRAAQARNEPVVDVLGAMVRHSISDQSELNAELDRLEWEFSGNGIFAQGIRHVTRVARRALARRLTDPFFEFKIIESVKEGTEAFRQAIRETAPCAVLQVRPGPIDQPQRDLLFSFLPPASEGESDPEESMRVLHAAFNFMNAHRTGTRFCATRELPSKQCPFYTACALPLRHAEPHICKNAAWESADWAGWDRRGACWYGTAVRTSRPPQTPQK